jgi:UDP-N-acetylmuramate dehydrogenase
MKSQPIGCRSAGSFFKNPPNDKAGRLIEEAGCKGLNVGGAEVSGVHANFIINKGGATAADVLSIAGKVQQSVYERFGVWLEPEVRYIN